MEKKVAIINKIIHRTTKKKQILISLSKKKKKKNLNFINLFLNFHFLYI
jgi:hypothetical protein